MSIETFDEDLRAAPPNEDEAFVLDLDGYEGPIDALLHLTRLQRVDVTQISILALADQYLAFIQSARRLRLELAADYLVMAAWLAYLKSRLLLPGPEDDAEPTGEEMAAALKFQLQRLQAMQDAGVRLMARPRLGREVFARGDPEPLSVTARTVYEVSLYDLLKAYAERRAGAAATHLRIEPLPLYAIEEAMQRLRGLIGQMPQWRQLEAFLPAELRAGVMGRSALASTFAASLELCREGALQIRQDSAFGPIFLRAAQGS